MYSISMVARYLLFTYFLTLFFIVDTITDILIPTPPFALGLVAQLVGVSSQRAKGAS